MDSQKMELRKLRNFSDNLNDTFQFLKQEFKPLLTCIVAICGVFMVLSGVVGGIYQKNTLTGIMRIFKGLEYQPQRLSDIFNASYFLLIFLSIFSVILMHVVIAAYFKVYELKNKVSPTIDEVWQVTIRFIVPVFFYTIIYAIITIISMLFCVIPFFYFATVFAPFTMIYVIEEVSFTEGFSRCFKLIRDNYLASLGIYFVNYTIYYVCAGIVGVIVGVLTFVTAYFTTKDVGVVSGIITGTLGIFGHIFYLIFIISVALNYFNLTEQYDGSGLLKRIDNLGAAEVSTIEEQY